MQKGGCILAMSSSVEKAFVQKDGHLWCFKKTKLKVSKDMAKKSKFHQAVPLRGNVIFY